MGDLQVDEEDKNTDSKFFPGDRNTGTLGYLATKLPGASCNPN